MADTSWGLTEEKKRTFKEKKAALLAVGDEKLVTKQHDPETRRLGPLDG